MCFGNPQQIICTRTLIVMFDNAVDSNYTGRCRICEYFRPDQLCNGRPPVRWVGGTHHLGKIASHSTIARNCTCTHVCLRRRRETLTHTFRGTLSNERTRTRAPVPRRRRRRQRKWPKRSHRRKRTQHILTLSLAVKKIDVVAPSIASLEPDAEPKMKTARFHPLVV